MDCWSSWVPTVDRFLCWSLRTGTIVIGSLNLVELHSVPWSTTALSQVLALGMLVYYGDELVTTLAVEEGLLGQDFNKQVSISAHFELIHFVYSSKRHSTSPD